MAATRPGDLIGSDDQGRVRIDRVIPLPWVLGVIGAVGLHAASMHYTQQHLVEAIWDLSVEVKELRVEVRALSLRDVEQTIKLLEHERRITTLETRR